MSHFSVAIIHRPNQDIEDLLAPYDENLEVLKYTRQQAIDHVRETYDCEGKSDDECFEFLAEQYKLVDDNGNIYDTYNPNSKWDRWVVGGRASGILKEIGKEEYCNECKLYDLDLSRDEDKYQEALHFWDVYVDKVEEDPKVYSFRDPEYFKERYGDRETYARRKSSFGTYAVITPDGKWNAAGDVGWQGISSERHQEAADWDDNYYSRFLETDDKDLLITIVDCHI